MATVLQLRERLKPLLSRETVYGILFDVIRSFEAYLVDLNLIQLEKGQDIFGREVGTYSRATELESLFGDGPKPRQPKVEGQPYNFEWTGGLFDGFTLEISGDTAIFTSRDSKTPLLKEKYGEIFGLQEGNLIEAIDTKIGPAFLIAFRKRIGL